MQWKVIANLYCVSIAQFVFAFGFYFVFVSGACGVTKLLSIYFVFNFIFCIFVFWIFILYLCSGKVRGAYAVTKLFSIYFVFNFIFCILVFCIFILYLCSGKVRGTCAVTKLTWSAPSKADISVTSGATSALAQAFLLFCNSSSISLTLTLFVIQFLYFSIM